MFSPLLSFSPAAGTPIPFSVTAPSNDESGDYKRNVEGKELETLGKWAEMRYNAMHERKESCVSSEWTRGRVDGGLMAANDAASVARGFRVQRKELEECSVVECFGRLTSENVPLLKDAMREACGRKGRIVLDLKEVPMMDSSGLGAVVTLHVSARTRGCRLEVVNASKQILELFSIANVLSLFEATGRCGGRLM